MSATKMYQPFYGVEGSPPPGGQGTIPTLIERARTAEAKVTELAAQVAVMAGALEALSKADQFDDDRMPVYPEEATASIEYIVNRFTDIAKAALSNLPAEARKVMELVEAATKEVEAEQKCDDFMDGKIPWDAAAHGEAVTEMQTAYKKLKEAVRNLRGGE